MNIERTVLPLGKSTCGKGKSISQGATLEVPVLEVDKAEDVRKRVIALAESQSLVIHGYLWLICTSLRDPIDWPPLGHSAEMAERGIKRGGL